MNINSTNEQMKTCVLTTLIVINSDEQVNKQKNTSTRNGAQNVQQLFKKVFSGKTFIGIKASQT